MHGLCGRPGLTQAQGSHVWTYPLQLQRGHSGRTSWGWLHHPSCGLHSCFSWTLLLCSLCYPLDPRIQLSRGKREGKCQLLVLKYKNVPRPPPEVGSIVIFLLSYLSLAHSFGSNILHTSKSKSATSRNSSQTLIPGSRSRIGSIHEACRELTAWQTGHPILDRQASRDLIWSRLGRYRMQSLGR